MLCGLTLFAPSAPAQRLDIQYAGDQVNEFNGWCVSSGFDCDGDGIDDVAVAAPWWDPIFGFADQGVVTVYSGATHAPLWGYTEIGTSARTGFSCALVGDVDGDGYGDLAVGAPGLNNGDGLGDVVGGDPFRTVSGLGWAGDADDWITVNATASNYGPGDPGTLGIPSLTAQNDPGIGTTFTVAIGNSLGSATTGLVFLGFTRLYLPTSAGGVLLVAPSQTFVVPIPASGATLSGAIPLDPALLGLDVYLQVLETDPGAAHKPSSTAGLDARIGVDY